jgi:hypothetical protein
VKRCHHCGQEAAPNRSRCEPCAAVARAKRAKVSVRKTPEQRSEMTCSFCKEPGHGRRTCAAWQEACSRLGEVEAHMRARALEPLQSKNPFTWEVQAQRRAQVTAVFEYIATLPPSKASAELAIKAARAALEFV